ncbi:MAG TPA: TolC family protein [Ignavibacteriaceae bacterium]|nr:TolC family protein [Ignavibacteriaceae bacterium]
MKTLISLSLIIFLFQISSYAQNDSLSLSKAIEIALKNNQNITLANQEIQKSKSVLKEIRSNLFPSIYGTSHYIYAPENGYDPVVTNGGEYGLQVAANYNIFDGGIRRSQINQANVNIKGKNLTLEQTKSEIRYLVRVVYYEISSVKNELKAQRKGVSELTNYLQLLEQLKAGGIATESDVLKAKVDLNNLLITLESSKQNIEKLTFDMNNLLGRRIEAPLNIYEDFPSDTTASLDSAANKMIDLELAQNEAKASSYNINIAKGERLPKLSIMGDAGVLGVKPNNIKQDAGYSFFLTFSVPLFTWGGISSRIQQAEITQNQALTKVDITDRALQTQRLTILSEIELSKKNMKNYQSSIKTAEENYLSSEARFKGGSGTNLDVLDAHRLVIQAESDYNNAVLQYQTARASLLRLYGM